MPSEARMRKCALARASGMAGAGARPRARAAVHATPAVGYRWRNAGGVSARLGPALVPLLDHRAGCLLTGTHGRSCRSAWVPYQLPDFHESNSRFQRMPEPAIAWSIFSRGLNSHCRERPGVENNDRPRFMGAELRGR
jgi:hypothetical protein